MEIRKSKINPCQAQKIKKKDSLFSSFAFLFLFLEKINILKKSRIPFTQTIKDIILGRIL